MCMTIPGWIESKRETEREGGEGREIGRERNREWGRGERGRRRKRELKSLCACVCVMKKNGFLSGFFLLKNVQFHANLFLFSGLLSRRKGHICSVTTWFARMHA